MALDTLPRGLNFETNRDLAFQHGDQIGYCAQCGVETKAQVLAYNGIHSGHKVCYRCLRQIRHGDTDTTQDDLDAGERTGTMPWENAKIVSEKELPF